MSDGNPTHTTLAVIGDIHGHLLYLGRVVEHIRETGVDGVLMVGDLGHVLGRGSRHSKHQLVSYARSLKAVMDKVRPLGVPVLWVPGNHDLPTISGPGNVDGTGAKIGGLRVSGIGGSGPDKRDLTYEWDEDDIRGLALPPCDVILSHCPPARTALDWVPRAGRHCGSEAVRERAESQRGFLVCGHIHESPGAEQIGDCLCVNVGGLGRPFGEAQVGYIRRSKGMDSAWHVSLESGRVPHWEHPPPG